MPHSSCTRVPRRSISYASTLGKPIYVMENGIPAAADNDQRGKWINGCLEIVRNPPPLPQPQRATRSLLYEWI